LLAALRKQAHERLTASEREREIAFRLGKAYDLWLRNQHAAAEAETLKAMAVLPTHPTALAMRDLIAGSARRMRGKGRGAPDAPAAAEVLREDETKRGGATRKYLSTADQAAWRLLDKRIDVDWRGATMKNVLGEIAEKSGANLYIDWITLEGVGIEQDGTVELRLRDVPLSTVLDVVLDRLPGSIEPAAFDVDDGIVVITSRRQLKMGAVTNEDDISDLLNLPVDSGEKTNGEPTPGKAGEGNEDDQDEDPTREELVEMLATLIQDQIGHQADWQAYGGETNSLRELNGMLIIRARPVHQAEIQALLETMRSRLVGRIGQALAERAIAPLLEQADDLRLKERHGEALKRVEKALIVRPDHPRALALRTAIAETIERQKAAVPR